MPLIQAVAGDDWWQDVTVPMLETVRRRLRALVKLIPKGKKTVRIPASRVSSAEDGLPVAGCP